MIGVDLCGGIPSRAVFSIPGGSLQEHLPVCMMGSCVDRNLSPMTHSPSYMTVLYRSPWGPPSPLSPPWIAMCRLGLTWVHSSLGRNLRSIERSVNLGWLPEIYFRMRSTLECMSSETWPNVGTMPHRFWVAAYQGGGIHTVWAGQWTPCEPLAAGQNPSIYKDFNLWMRRDPPAPTESWHHWLVALWRYRPRGGGVYACVVCMYMYIGRWITSKGMLLCSAWMPIKGSTCPTGILLGDMVRLNICGITCLFVFPSF